MKRKLIRKLFYGVMTLLVTAISFTSTTYAWFKINSDARVSGFDFEVTGGEGFLVSIDGEKWTNDLTTYQMKTIMILGYDSVNYKLKDGKLVYASSELEVTSDAMNRILEKISLLPLTSKDGIKLYDLYDSPAQVESGRYVEFDVYFRHASQNPKENVGYEIYLLGQDRTLDDGTIVKATSISSVATTVSLKADMTTIIGEYGPDTSGHQTITVHSSNALRFSIQDTSLATPKATIYELSDDRNALDLGSYATDYGKGMYMVEKPANYASLVGADKALVDTKLSAYDNASPEQQELFRLYGCDTNAMYTYYNKLRPSSPLSGKLMIYGDKPTTVRELDDTAPSITTVKAGEDAKKITFRFWLEGWDADCFDGLANSIKVRLSFTAKKVTV